MDSTSLYEHLNNLGFSGDDLLKVEAVILEAEATVIRLLHGNGGEDFHAYLDPLFGVFASLFAERDWDESVEETVLELVSDALIERVQTVQPIQPPGGPERTEEFCERYGSFWVPACFPAQLKRNLAGPIKQWHARAILAQLTCTANHDSAIEQPARLPPGATRGKDYSSTGRQAGDPCRLAAETTLGIAEEAMHERPNLPLATEAAIEHAREQVVSRRLLLYEVLFRSEALSFIKGVQGLPVQRKAAALKLALQGYSSELFGAEAGYYLQHARDESELRSWLIALAARVKAEVIQERRKRSIFYEVHCTALEQERTVAEKLKQRIDSWVRRFRHEAPRNSAAPDGGEGPSAACTPELAAAQDSAPLGAGGAPRPTPPESKSVESPRQPIGEPRSGWSALGPASPQTEQVIPPPLEQVRAAVCEYAYPRSPAGASQPLQPVVANAGITNAHADRAAKRQKVVNPLLKKKRWKRGRLVTESGLGKATVYGYLDGTRSWITPENRRAMADALGIGTEALPE